MKQICSKSGKKGHPCKDCPHSKPHDDLNLCGRFSQTCHSSSGNQISVFCIPVKE